MIDLSAVRRILADVSTDVERLDGADLDERNAVRGTADTNIRRQRAQRSQDLQHIAAQLELAASLVRNEYWVARGKPNHLKREP